MPIYRDRVYPSLVDRLGNPEPIRQVRQRILPLAHGTVLEIGAGSGLNFAYYDPSKIRLLYALEPNKAMIRMAKKRIPSGLRVEFLDIPGEQIPLPDDSVDAVVSTFVLSVVPQARDAVRSLSRVLKSGGRLIFFEHAVAPEPKIRNWQHRCEPVLHWIFEGLSITRDSPAVLMQAGYRFEQMEASYLARFPKSWACFCWGTAIPPSP